MSPRSMRRVAAVDLLMALLAAVQGGYVLAALFVSIAATWWLWAADRETLDAMRGVRTGRRP